jgi:hypothetical protein
LKVFPGALAALLLGAAAACTSSPSGSAKPAPAPTPAGATGEAKTKQAQTLLDALTQKAPPTGVDEDENDRSAEIKPFFDPATKLRLQKFRKEPPFYEKDGRLFNAIVRDSEGVKIVRQDATFYYVEAPADAPPEDPRKKHEQELQQVPIIDMPAEEAEKVVPGPSKVKIRFEEISEGLPKVGMWRENFAVGDLDGDGRPEIVSPPPRLSGRGLGIFKLVGKRWESVNAEIEGPEQLGFSYGGVSLGDLDGDGRLDIVFGGHGRGPTVLYNKGNFKFRQVTGGMPAALSTRALEVGDLDGDGKPDILVLSDMPELQMAGGKPAPQPPSEYVLGYDVRAYLNEGESFREVVSGLDRPCFGYTLGLWTPEKGKDEAPFFVSACRYFGGIHVLFTFNRKSLSFEHAGVDIVERHAGHQGSAIGTYKGLPAAYVSYFKNTPSGSSREIAGDGISIYYREGETWKRKRVWKRVGEKGNSQGIAVGDLNGDGLDDIVLADEFTKRVRVFFQTPEGEFEELDTSLEPTFVNHPTCVRIADVDGDGRKDIIMMYQYLTGDETRSGGIRVFRNVR